MLATHEFMTVTELKNISDTARGNSSQRQNKPDIVRLLPLLLHLQCGITKKETMSNMLGTCLIYCFKPKHRLKGFFSSRSKAGSYTLHTYKQFLPCFTDVQRGIQASGETRPLQLRIYKVGGSAQQQYINTQGK